MPCAIGAMRFRHHAYAYRMLIGACNPQSIGVPDRRRLTMRSPGPMQNAEMLFGLFDTYMNPILQDTMAALQANLAA